MRGAGVGGSIQPLEVGRTQRTNVAKHMCRQITVGIVPYQSRLKVDAGEPRPLIRKTRYLIVRQTKTQCDGLETRARLTQSVKARNVLTPDQA